jgi:hypothetical protein
VSALGGVVLVAALSASWPTAAHAATSGNRSDRNPASVLHLRAIWN